MAEKRILIELTQTKKSKKVWLRPECILYFEKNKTPTYEEIIIHLNNGKTFTVIDDNVNRKRLQSQFDLG